MIILVCFKHLTAQCKLFFIIPYSHKNAPVLDLYVTLPMIYNYHHMEHFLWLKSVIFTDWRDMEWTEILSEDIEWDLRVTTVIMYEIQKPWLTLLMTLITSVVTITMTLANTTFILW